MWVHDSRCRWSMRIKNCSISIITTRRRCMSVMSSGRKGFA
uniref:Uncharacterized protein n=1 Tax=Arundo donax TaxID=35708 RepID=A0A0A9GA64_ARUDO